MLKIIIHIKVLLRNSYCSSLTTNKMCKLQVILSNKQLLYQFLQKIHKNLMKRKTNFSMLLLNYQLKKEIYRRLIMTLIVLSQHQKIEFSTIKCMITFRRKKSIVSIIELRLKLSYQLRCKFRIDILSIALLQVIIKNLSNMIQGSYLETQT